jgi:hypothetical protein
MRRLDLIDGLRGYFLVFMLINHMVFDGGYWLVQVNLRQIAFVEDAQGFVFLSGLLVGLVYVGKMVPAGFMAGARALWKRAGELYLYAMGSLALVLTAALLLPQASRSWEDWLGQLSWTNGAGLAAAAALIYQPTLLDILPQYVVYMLAAPFVLWACLKGHAGVVMAGSGLLWLAAQFGLHLPLTTGLNQALANLGDTGVRGHFNLLAWQLVFIGGMVLGAATRTGQIRWDAVFRPDRTLLPKAALALCLFLAPFRIGLNWGGLPPLVLERFTLFENRGDFGLVYLLNFAAAATGLAWLLIAGPRSARAWVRRLAAICTGLFRLPFLRLIGRHSLQTYVWHLMLVFAVRIADFHAGPFPQPVRILLALACIALLALPAIWRERARLFAAPQAS